METESAVAAESQVSSSRFRPRPSPYSQRNAIPPESDADRDLDFDAIERENGALLEALLELRRKRCSIAELVRDEEALRRELQHQVNAAQLQQEQALVEFRSLLSQQRNLSGLLRRSWRWNALNDCFSIATKGAFATINGLRLGSESPVLEVGNVDASLDTLTSNGHLSPMGPPVAASTSGGPFASFFHSSTSDTGPSRSDSAASDPALHRVPWSEINAALGHVVLILSELQVRMNRPHHTAAGTAPADRNQPTSSARSPSPSLLLYRHDLLPLGSTSRIGIRRLSSDPKAAPAWYNLWYTDETFQFFGRRNFNAALTGLVECVSDAAQAVQQRDRTVALPHELALPGGGGAYGGSGSGNNVEHATVGGLPVVYFGADGRCGGVEWTRAMKYLLTDLKHLLTVRLVAGSGGLCGDGSEHEGPASSSA